MERPKQRQRRRRARDPEAVIRELTDLHIGAPVVHEDHGVGRYRGLTTLDVDGVLTEFLLLEYAGGDKLYVPVQSLHLVTRYSGAAPEDAPLHRLGSDQWAKAKRKAAEQARDTAAELLNLYAQRAARTGTKLAFDETSYQRFALEFPFEETEDQLTAIERVLADLASDAADGPRRLRRRRLRQDGGRAALGVRRRAGRLPGRGARADDAARGAAPPHVQRPLRRMARARRALVALPRARAGSAAALEGARRGHRSTS